MRNKMTGKRKLLLLLLAVCMLVCGTGASYFNEEYTDVGLDAALQRARELNEWMSGKTDEEIAAEKHISVWDVLSTYGTEAPPEPLITVEEGDTWEELVAELLEKYDTDESHVGIGYYHTGTGEEHYICPDTYRVSASMFKIPLNMILADRVSSGEMTMDTEIYGIPYSWYQYRTIVQSDNERSVSLFNYLGGYSSFKTLQIPYLGNDPSEDLGWNYQVDNYYNPREFIYMLKMLYEDPERFPGVLENMLDAEPYSYFHQYERRYPIAQKYGFVQQTEGSYDHTYVNTCGVVFTDEPFCAVVFTDNVGKAYDLISEFCMVMCDYTNMRSQQEAERLEEQKASDEAALQTAEQEILAAVRADEEQLAFASPVSAEQENGQTEKSEAGSRFHMSAGATILLVLIAAAALVACVFIFRNNAAGRINGFWAVIAILLAGLGMSFCVIGSCFGTVYADPAGDPKETAERFFAAIEAENYEEAYQCLANYSSLGLENMPSSEEGQMLSDALKASYEHSLRGECEKNKLSATQSVALRYLNVRSAEEAVERKVEIVLGQIAESRDRSEIYDEEGYVLPSVREEVYRTALAEVLETPDLYYSTKEMKLELTYRDGEWLITADSDLISALSGGTVS